MNQPILPEDKLQQARTKAIQYWMDLYLQILEQELKRQEASGLDKAKLIFHQYRTETRPRLLKIARRFQDAGLDLAEEMEFEGPRPHPQGRDVVWPNPRHPKVTFYWPDGHDLVFTGREALSAMGFFLFWQNYQTALLPRQQESRIIMPGDKEHRDYFQAKAADQAKGIEPS